MENNKPTAEQMEALRTFAAANGRTWKSKLNDAWMSGRYSDYPATDRCDLLQQVRNNLGPSWLVRFRLPDPQCKMAEFPGDRPLKGGLIALELTNGEGAMVDGLFDFLSFMVSEGAPVPRHPNFAEEAELLLARYVKHHRREQMRYVSALRVSRGETPLPTSLTEGR